MRNRGTMSFVRGLAFVAGISLLPALAAAQAPQQTGGASGVTPQASVTVSPINPPKNTIYVASGATVSNNGIIIGDNGVVLIDTGISSAAENLELAQIKSLTTKPITTAILTHSDGDHVNGVSALPAGVTIIAQENCKKEMEEAAKLIQQPPPLPTKTVHMKDAMTIDGVRFEFLHVAPAHTSGDLLVYLPDEKIVFTGDIITDTMPYPLIHLEKNGSSEGWIETVSAMLQLDANTFVSGHGVPHTKDEVQRRLDATKARRAQIQSLVAQGKSLDEIKQQFGENAPPPPAGGRGPRFASFTEVVYQELTKK